ncbi:MAG TPA: PP2C family protein-serine/threonine phosphatase [Candidatus Polarisedimenticolaceae bacterium]|nr:PP2C family protein-serine/threonine phosphatase [Candidatus Polarisedimenticolaceae bacterium]
MDYRQLFRKLDGNLEGLKAGPAGLSALLGRLVEDFKDDLGIVGGRLYRKRGEFYVLREEYPAGHTPKGFRLPVDYPPLQELLQQGFSLHDLGDPGVDRALEEPLVRENTFAAIALREPPLVLAFSLKPGAQREQVVYTLNTLRHVLSLKLRKDQLEDGVAQVRSIQLSLLPANAPRFADYDLWARMQPAEEVGGDLYDFIRVGERQLGIAIADSAGHGLPAALQARDAIIGLRMGVEERLRLTATVEKLNKVISRSALSSRFISLFYGELEPGGNLVYCNAGHNPPLLWRGGAFEELSRGGLVLGPNPEAQYERGYATLVPGAVLVAYTDGIVEAEDAQGEQFGTARLRELIAGRRFGSARELTEAVFAAVVAFSGRETPRDDQTVLVALRPTG